jgi:hypothetical protein
MREWRLENRKPILATSWPGILISESEAVVIPPLLLRNSLSVPG